MDPLTPDQALEAYSRLITENDQAVPLLLVCHKGIPIPVALTGEFPNGSMQDVLAQAIPEIIGKLGSAPDWIIFHVEAYMQTVEAPDFQEQVDAGAYAPGALGNARQAGDFTIMECANINCVTASGEGEWGIVKPFERVGGEIIWGEAQLMPGAPEGGVPDQLRKAFL